MQNLRHVQEREEYDRETKEGETEEEEEKDRPAERGRERGKAKPVSPDRGSTLYFHLPHN